MKILRLNPQQPQQFGRYLGIRSGLDLAPPPIMARPLRVHLPGLLYHVMSRGNSGEALFKDDEDYARYLELLRSCARRFGATCEGYCLMKTHLHLVLRAGALSLSGMMQQLNSAYCQGFNRRHKRRGHLVEGRFKALIVDSDLYFLRLIRYVLRNPVTAGYVERAEDWRWSSVHEAVSPDDCNRVTSVRRLWSALGAEDAVAARERLVSLLPDASDDDVGNTIYVLGSEAFKRRLDASLSPHRENDDYPRSHRFACRPSLGRLLDDKRGAALECSIRQAFFEWAYTLREIGRHLGRKTATIWARIHRWRRKRLNKQGTAVPVHWRENHRARAHGQQDTSSASHEPPAGAAQGRVDPRFTTDKDTAEGYCFEWCTRFCAETPCDSS